MISKKFLITIFPILIMSCAGGGGSSSPAPVTPTVQDTGPTYEELKSNYESNYEYQRQWGLSMINASAAYARGSTGKNITIGITDSGLDTSHSEIDVTRINAGSALEYDNYKPTTSDKRHGTMVASIAAGSLTSEDDNPMHGVAFEAEIFFVAIELAEPDDTYEPIDLGDGSGGDPDPNFEGTDNFFEWVASVYTSRNIDIVNNSYGFSGNIEDYSEDIIRNAFPKTIAALAQENTNPADRTIFVWAAGNAGGYADSSILDENGNVKCDQDVNFCSPEVYPGMTYFIDEVQGHSIAVVSVDEEGVISDFSNRCGLAAEFCIAAPGESVIGAYPTSTDDLGIYADVPNEECLTDNSCFARISGTSFAAPMVSGALAVLFEHFEGQLGSTEIVTRLFATANDNGIYSDSSIYGHGLMDLNAATNPVGALSVTTTNSIFGPTAPLALSGMNIYNSSVAQSLSNALINKSIIALDELGSPFRVPLGGLISSPSSRAQRIDKVGAFNIPKIRTYSNQLLEFEYIDRTPLNENHPLQFNHIESYAEINKSLNIMDHTNNRIVSVGFIENFNYDLSIKDNFGSKFKNPYIDFSKYGFLFSQTFKKNQMSLSWIANIGQPKITIEEVFHDHDLNINLSMLLKIAKLPKLQIGYLRENDRLMGLGASGAFDLSKHSETHYIGLYQDWDFGIGKFYFTGYKGFTQNSDFSNSLISSFKDIQSSFINTGFLLENLFSNIDMEIEFTKPIYISGGVLNLEIPVYRDRYLNLYTEQLGISLKSPDPETIASIKFKKNFKNYYWFLGVENVNNPNYFKAKEDFTNISLGMQLKF